MGSSNTNVPLYPSLANGSTRLTILSLSKERGEGRLYQHYFKIPLYPLCQRGIKTPKTEGLPFTKRPCDNWEVVKNVMLNLFQHLIKSAAYETLARSDERM